MTTFQKPRANPHRKRRDIIPYWLLAIILLGVILGWAIVADSDYRQIWRTLSGGVITTLYVTFIAFALACLLGLAVAMARTSSVRVLREIATFYTEIVRGIPILVLLFYVAFVGAPALVEAFNWAASPLIDAGAMPALTVRNFDLTWRAIFALTIGYSAFIAEVFRAGIEAVEKGQIEAARSLGLSRWHTFRLIIAPQAIRTILPPLGNDFVSMIKDSALVSALGVQDITQLGKVYSASSFKFFETYNVVAFLYLTMTISLSLLVRALEHRMARGRQGER
ncbi:amino acid ABC transporter permease [Pelagibacterium xiamenense]|uniref:amino acid ABC transporter permease n=1 Tax=Pelagibacterium xiamenense TaxID=2901140 RepID=UPI001E46B0E1|nr:amino acid ABC transporter permease [Pelagibacterium xiamenense]MCD7058763.1 amino acid ABC transporter permease [Pelagibacterium xiamenense]